MADLARHNPTGRFTGLADLYAKHRPSYPEAVVDYIVARCRLGPQSLLVDVGCGTGISTRLLALRGVPVMGIEPNAEMRSRAMAESVPEGKPSPTYRDGRAETTGLPEGCADAVLAAQAFHWFEPKAALHEFQRILKPGGWVALVWNERDESDSFTADYGAVIRSTPGAAKLEMDRGKAGEPLLLSHRYQDGERILFQNTQELDEESLVGRALSASYAPREPDQVERFVAVLRGVFDRYQSSGEVTLRYVTSVYSARAVQA
jgi:SAM-dependent methyltransferase